MKVPPGALTLSLSPFARCLAIGQPEGWDQLAMLLAPSKVIGDQAPLKRTVDLMTAGKAYCWLQIALPVPDMIANIHSSNCPIVMRPEA